ncbi:cobalt-precorrin-6A reductase [Carnimonas bestiolae]|uniref:cobalt-precorrin-6A reductase n=1 Tax=Carnimonas bestiolae TaxID=3402172 RepID=UPI003EDC5668
MATRVLILGGTAQARLLAQQIAPQLDVRLSLAGVTQTPINQSVPTRRGGFGGAQGLARHLRDQAIDALVLATHPFAARMPFNAAQAAASANVPLLRLLPPPWQSQPGDAWHIAPSLEAVPALLGSTPHTVLLTTGRQQLATFAQAPQHHYIVRSIEALPADLPLPNLTSIRRRGPFSLEDEITLMKTYAIDRLVSKNSGMDSVKAKLTAARELGIPVIIVERPPSPPMETVSSIKAAVDWLRGQPSHH